MKLRVTIAVVSLAAVIVGLTLFRHESYHQGKPASYWVRKARAGDHSQRTITALETLGPEAILPLLQDVVRKDSPLQQRYLRIYEKFPVSVQKLFARPRPGQETRDSCYMILNRISVKGPDATALVPELIKLVQSDDKRPSGTFVDGNTHQALPHGIYVRAVAADMLADIGAGAAPAVPALVERLRVPRSKQDYFYDRIPRALGYIGPAATEAIPALKELLQDENVDTTLWAGEAMWKIDPALAGLVEPVLERALRHTNTFTRLKAARAHWTTQRKASVVLPVLVKLLRDTENLWMVDTLRAFEEIGPEANEALPALADKLDDPEPVVRQVAAEVRSKIDRN